MTRARWSRAMRADPSVLPLSATSTSPCTSSSLSPRQAALMQSASVSASLRHGSSTVTSGCSLMHGSASAPCWSEAEVPTGSACLGGQLACDPHQEGGGQDEGHHEAVDKESEPL